MWADRLPGDRSSAQALELVPRDADTVVVTTNPKHLALFVPAARWDDVDPETQR